MIDPVLTDTRDRLADAGALAGVTPDRVTVGDRAILVELSPDDAPVGADTPLAGVAHRPRGADEWLPTSDPTLEDLLEPIEIGASVDREPSVGVDPDDADGPDGGATVGPDPTGRAVAVATLNALSAPFLEWRDGDPMALLEPSIETITTVGLFRPAFRTFDDVDVRVIERRAVGQISTPPGVCVSTFEPDEAERAMDGAEVVFVTGSAFVYGGASRYLEIAPPSATVVVIGATASFLPGPLFEAGVDVVAGAAVEDPDAVRAAIRAGNCGTGLHDSGLRKGYVATQRPSGIRLDPNASDSLRSTDNP
ncbi:Rossmann-like domain-containing protein [Natrarchaeobius chitinivorans]|uniref:Putative heavy-metal chelation domain-containing protein n=1 Tax=Natrarchaeobius chitinivorans TaxID=1679083 RepID=A0A3N6LTW4_NATCH|nr:DUF364 domain-containing protein [Natrarchaeobius chitinivorans]RQG90934.1 hypothetical protein EA473_19285 [Natrarchaeobius chitinivorans]